MKKSNSRIKLSDIEIACNLFENMTTDEKDDVFNYISLTLLSIEFKTGIWSTMMKFRSNKLTGKLKRFYRILSKFNNKQIKDFSEAFTDAPLTVKRKQL